MGVVRSALDIFTRLELWENVIYCHQLLEENKKAEKILLRLLESNPNSPKLNCLLGDLRQVPELYEKAWVLSGHRYARAMRSLGAYYYKKENFEKCISSYQNALAINSLFENAWFVLGCAAMRIEKWETSIEAFQRVTHMDYDVSFFSLFFFIFLKTILTSYG